MCLLQATDVELNRSEAFHNALGTLTLGLALLVLLVLPRLLGDKPGPEVA